MKYRMLGRTGLKVSVIGMGTWQFGGEWGKSFTQAEVDQMFRRAKDLGINLVDTAECYGDHLSESLIGHAVKGQRDRWIIASKFGHRFHGFMNRTDERDVHHVRDQPDSCGFAGVDAPPGQGGAGCTDTNYGTEHWYVAMIRSN